MDKCKEFFPEWWDELVFDGPETPISVKAKLSPQTPAWVVAEYEAWWAEKQAYRKKARQQGKLTDK